VFEQSSWRRAFGLRLAAAVELHSAPASEEALALLARMRRAVDETATDLIDAAAQGTSETELIEQLLDGLRAKARQPGGQELLPMVERLSARIWPWPRGTVHAPWCQCAESVSAAEEACLCDLECIRDFVVEKVAALYARGLKSGASEIPVPRFRARFVRSDSLHAYFGGEGDKRFDVNALTQVRSKDILISLEFRPDGIELAAAGQTLYLLIHEIVCHAYQSLEEANRGNSDDTCGWTDGWMDALAWRLTEDWIVRYSVRLPAWLSDTPERGKRWCRSFHERRYAEPRCPPMRETDLKERQLAREGFDTLHKLWDQAQPPGADIESHRITAFSVALNHCSVEDGKRRMLIAALNTALIRRKPRLADVSGACSAFLDHRDPDQLLDDLLALNGLPTQVTAL
jgi:hypothetical protein